MGKTRQRVAVLRVCASCKWVYKATGSDTACPKCGSASYGARQIYGHRAYTYAKTQKPWKDEKMFVYELGLDVEIQAAQPKPPSRIRFNFEKRK